MNINAKISLYKPFESGKPNVPVNQITIENFCGAVMHDQYVCDQITAIRNEPNEDKQKELKRHLPTVTISGTFTQAKNDCLLQHSGFICLDVDQKENPRVRSFEGLRNEMESMPQVLFAALSVRGNGLMVIIPISNPTQHVAHYLSLERDFKRMGLVLDKSCKNVARLRYISHDPEAYYNPKARVYTKIFEEPKLPKEPAFYTSDTSTDLGRLVDAIAKSGKDITHTGDAKAEYENWLLVGTALYKELGEAGREAYHAISQHYRKYNRDATDKQFDAIVRNGYTNANAGSIFYLAQQAGIAIPYTIKYYYVPHNGIEEYSNKSLRIRQDKRLFFIPKKAVLEEVTGGLWLPEWFLQEEVMLKCEPTNYKTIEKTR